jgi:hypothetical protein
VRAELSTYVTVTAPDLLGVPRTAEGPKPVVLRAVCRTNRTIGVG